MVAEDQTYNSPSEDYYMGDTDPDWIDEGSDSGDPGVRSPVARDFVGQRVVFASTAAESPIAPPDTPIGTPAPRAGDYIGEGMESPATAARGPVAAPIAPPGGPYPKSGDVFDRLNADDVKPVLLSFLVVAVTLLLVFVTRVLWKRKKRDTILLVGMSGGGKTALFYQLRDGSTHRGTVTSMEPNEDRFILYSEAGQPNAKKLTPIHLVDVPGHPRLKPKIDEYLPQTAGIAFVVDALDFMPQVRPTAEYLYDVLAKELVVRRKIPILLACNKMDKVTAHSVDFIKRQLEKEIDKLRSTRKVASDADEGSDVVIGSADVAFTFDQCVNRITLCESSAMSGNVEFVEQFLREKVKA